MNKETKNIITKCAFHNCAKFKIALIAEFYKELTIRADTAEEAKELAEARVRERHVIFSNCGYSIGDIEIISAEEL